MSTVVSAVSADSDSLRAWLLRHFFHLLLIATSAAMWAVPMWILAALFGMHLPALAHVAAVAALYALNRFLVRGPRRASSWLRRYSAIAFVLLLCSLFLLVSTILFGVVGTVAGLVGPEADQAVAGFARWWSAGGMALLAGTLLFGYTGGQRQLRVNRIEVPLSDGMPGAADGRTGEWRILQLSDIHVGQNLSFAQLEGFIERANRESPDLICLTGDIADGPSADLDRFFPLFRRLRARFGVIAVLGNHDHYTGAGRVAAALEANGVRVLCDSALTLECEGARLHVIGLDDRGLDWARGVRDDAVLGRLLAEAPRGVPQLLLVHRPDVFRQAAREGVALTLSGHTHGGQLALPWFGGRRRNFAEFVTRFDRGAFRTGNSLLYVNCGLGVTGQRIRLFTPREISVFELRPAAIATEETGEARATA